jgi:hypothetical protein
MEQSILGTPDFVGVCDGEEEEIASNPKNAVSDLKVKIKNQGQCIIELTIDADDEENSYTIELGAARSYALNIPPGSVLSIASTECPEKKCQYSYEIA